MKPCFMFRCKKESEKMIDYLENNLKISVSRDVILGYYLLKVPDEKYEESILKGTLHAIEHNISCCWINSQQRRENIYYVPLAFAEVANEDRVDGKCWKPSTLRKIKHFAKKSSKALGKKVIFKSSSCFNVNFYLEREGLTEEDHSYLRNQFSILFTKKFCDTFFLPNAVLCDFYGQNIVQLKDMLP